MPASGGTPTLLTKQLYGGDVAVHAGLVYTHQSGSLYTVAPSGGTPTKLETGGEDAFAFAIDDSGIYFSTNSLGGLARVPLGGGVPVLLSKATAVRSVALSQSHVFWVEQVPGTGKESVRRVPK